MPSSPNYKRNYKEEYERYQGTPEQRKKRAARNRARRKYEKENGDLPSDVDVDHKRALSKGGKNGKGNLKAAPRGANRSFKRNSKGAMVSQTSSRERKKSV